MTLAVSPTAKMHVAVSRATVFNGPLGSVPANRDIGHAGRVDEVELVYPALFVNAGGYPTFVVSPVAAAQAEDGFRASLRRHAERAQLLGGEQATRLDGG